MAIRQQIRTVSATRPPLSAAVEFESVRQLSDSFLRVTLRGDELAAYDDPRPADAFKLMLPPGGSGDVVFPRIGDDGIPTWDEGTQPVMRAFTVREFDPDRLRLTFDIVVHPGLTLGWLRQAEPGARLGLAGMRADFAEGDGVDAHLLVGDAAAVPAVAAILDQLTPATPAVVVLAVDHEDDRGLVRERAGARLTWVPGGSPVGEGNPLVEAVRSQPRPPGRVQAWICAEAGTTRQVRAHVLEAWALDRDDLHAAAYWKSGLDATANDAAALARYREVMATGADPTDPDTRERVEFAVV